MFDCHSVRGSGPRPAVFPEANRLMHRHRRSRRRRSRKSSLKRYQVRRGEAGNSQESSATGTEVISYVDTHSLNADHQTGGKQGGERENCHRGSVTWSEVIDSYAPEMIQAGGAEKGQKGRSEDAEKISMTNICAQEATMNAQYQAGEGGKRENSAKHQAGGGQRGEKSLEGFQAGSVTCSDDDKISMMNDHAQETMYAHHQAGRGGSRENVKAGGEERTVSNQGLYAIRSEVTTSSHAQETMYQAERKSRANSLKYHQTGGGGRELSPKHHHSGSGGRIERSQRLSPPDANSSHDQETMHKAGGESRENILNYCHGVGESRENILKYCHVGEESRENILKYCHGGGESSPKHHQTEGEEENSPKHHQTGGGSQKELHGLPKVDD